MYVNIKIETQADTTQCLLPLSCIYHRLDLWCRCKCRCKCRFSNFKIFKLASHISHPSDSIVDQSAFHLWVSNMCGYLEQGNFGGQVTWFKPFCFWLKKIKTSEKLCWLCSVLLFTWLFVKMMAKPPRYIIEVCTNLII